MAGKAKPQPNPSGGLGRAVWLQGLLCGAVIAAMPAVGLLLAMLLAPAGLVLFVVDRSPARSVTRTVLLAGIAVAGHGVAMLWHKGNSMAAAVELVGDFHLVASAWAAQGGGWLLAECAPLLAGLALEANAQAKIAMLRRRREAYVEEWTLPSERGP